MVRSSRKASSSPFRQHQPSQREQAVRATRASKPEGSGRSGEANRSQCFAVRNSRNASIRCSRSRRTRSGGIGANPFSLRGTITGRLSSSPSSRRRIEWFPGWFRLFRFSRPRTGAEQMAKRRQNLYMIAYDFGDCQQWRREQRAWYAPQPVPKHERRSHLDRTEGEAAREQHGRDGLALQNVYPKVYRGGYEGLPG